MFGGVGATALLADEREAFATTFGKPEPIQTAQTATRRGLPPVKITDVKVILTEVGRSRFCNVKVMTDEPGLYGVGDGNHAERVGIVGQTIDEYLKPLVVGRNVEEIEDIWQTAYVAPYWRQDVDAFNAMAAIDGALWALWASAPECRCTNSSVARCVRPVACSPMRPVRTWWNSKTTCVH